MSKAQKRQDNKLNKFITLTKHHICIQNFFFHLKRNGQHRHHLGYVPKKKSPWICTEKKEKNVRKKKGHMQHQNYEAK